MLPKDAYLFESSWEVCNKVGGIHTVLTTKLAQAQNEFTTRYMAIGPFLPANPNFHEEALPENFKEVFASLEKEGVKAHYGRWLTDGQPVTVLLDWQGLVPRLNDIKARFWEEFGLNSLNSDFYDTDQPLMWSTAVGLFVQEFAKKNTAPILFHGHEWLSAGAFLILKHCENVRSVFTTHATVLGRALSSQGEDIYTRLHSINPDESAERHTVVTKHQLEKLAATNATVFTTVSKLTGREATVFLGRTPDFITENGVDTELFPAFDQLSSDHITMREELHDFMSAYFFPSHRFDLNATSYLFTMGRYEMHNKGYDLFLQSLSQLNEQMKKEKSKETVIACIFVPGDSQGVQEEVHFQRAAFRHLTDLLSTYTKRQQREVYHSIWEKNEVCASTSLLPKHVQDQIRQLILRLPIYEEVPLSPFKLRNPDQDAILTTARNANLKNRAEDNVKVVFFPAYFDGFDGIFNRNLYDIIGGCDLGVFPSLYEPWGYTPMESLAMGVPAITSDLAGFGLAVKEHTPDTQASEIIAREGRKDEDVVKDLTVALTKYLQETPRQKLHRRIAAYQAIQAFDWSFLYKKYRESYHKALDAHPTHS